MPGALARVAAAIAFAAACTAAAAQAFPSRPVRLVVPYPPGGITDILARAIAQRVSVQWGSTQMVVENRAGASGNLGVGQVAKAAPDGYTLVFGNSATHAINPALFRSVPFDPLRDFDPVTLVASVSNVLLVAPTVPARNLAELVSLARAKPGELTFASNSTGSSNHLTGELLKGMAGIDIVHVPYKGASAAALDVIGGRVSMMFDNLTTGVPHVKAGRLRALAVTSERRVSALPDVPTMVESGYPAFVVTPWWGIFVPAGTPKPVLERLHRDITGVLAGPELRESFAAQGTDVVTGTPESFRAFLAAELKRWGDVVRASGATAD